MDAQLKGSFYYVVTNTKRPFTIFWIILGGFMFLSYGMSYLFVGSETVVSYDLSFPIYIFGAVLGFNFVKNCIPYLIRMGSSRMNISLTIGLSFILLSIFNALIANTLYELMNKIAGEVNRGIFTIGIGDASYTFTHLADLIMKNMWFNRVVIDTSIGFFLLASFFLLGLIFYRYGYIGGFSALGLFMAVIVFGIAKEWLIDFFKYIFTDFHFIFFYQLFLTGIVIYLISYLLMRRLTID